MAPVGPIALPQSYKDLRRDEEWPVQVGAIYDKHAEPTNRAAILNCK